MLCAFYPRPRCRNVPRIPNNDALKRGLYPCPAPSSPRPASALELPSSLDLPFGKCPGGGMMDGPWKHLVGAWAPTDLLEGGTSGPHVAWLCSELNPGDKAVYNIVNSPKTLGEAASRRASGLRLRADGNAVHSPTNPPGTRRCAPLLPFRWGASPLCRIRHAGKHVLVAKPSPFSAKLRASLDVHIGIGGGVARRGVTTMTSVPSAQ